LCANRHRQQQQHSANIISIVYSSVDGTVQASVVTDYDVFGNLIQRLVYSSTKHTNLDAGASGEERTTKMIISPHLNHMLHAMWAPADSGKTAAAEYLMHGNHDFHSARALKSSAASKLVGGADTLQQSIKCSAQL